MKKTKIDYPDFLCFQSQVCASVKSILDTSTNHRETVIYDNNGNILTLDPEDEYYVDDDAENLPSSSVIDEDSTAVVTSLL